MELIFLDFLYAHVVVNKEDGNVESLWEQAELAVDVDDPFDQKCSRSVLDLGLHFLQVVAVDHALLFRSDHVLIYFLGEF